MGDDDKGTHANGDRVVVSEVVSEVVGVQGGHRLTKQVGGQADLHASIIREHNVPGVRVQESSVSEPVWVV